MMKGESAGRFSLFFLLSLFLFSPFQGLVLDAANVRRDGGAQHAFGDTAGGDDGLGLADVLHADRRGERGEMMKRKRAGSGRERAARK